MPRLLGIFFVFAALMCTAAAWSLLEPQGPAAWMWSFKAQEYRDLLVIGPLAGTGFLLLAAVMALASAGCFAQRAWGWRLAIALIGFNALADGARALAGAVVEGLVGLLVAGGVVWILCRPRVRRSFRD